MASGKIKAELYSSQTVDWDKSTVNFYAGEKNQKKKGGGEAPRGVWRNFIQYFMLKKET